MNVHLTNVHFHSPGPVRSVAVMVTDIYKSNDRETGGFDEGGQVTKGVWGMSWR